MGGSGALWGGRAQGEADEQAAAEGGGGRGEARRGGGGGGGAGEGAEGHREEAPDAVLLTAPPSPSTPKRTTPPPPGPGRPAQPETEDCATFAGGDAAEFTLSNTQMGLASHEQECSAHFRSPHGSRHPRHGPTFFVVVLLKFYHGGCGSSKC